MNNKGTPKLIEKMTERDCLRNGEWKKVNYYPVSIEKLQRASMREAAYLIAPMNIGEDYEYFDKVKHLLDIPEKPNMKEVSEKNQLINDALKELDWIAQGGQNMKEFMESYITIKEALMLLRDED
jgi:hypothetical protein